jgi:ankyrin repeat protein
MSSSHHQSDRISERNDYPDYLLGRNQESSPENQEVFSCAARNDLPGLQQALRRGGKVDYFYRPEDSKNALHVAAEHGYLRIAQELVSHGAQLNAISVATKDTALILACANKHTAVAKFLLEKGAEVNRGNPCL